MAPLRGLTSGSWLLASCWDDDSSGMRKPSQAAVKPRWTRISHWFGIGVHPCSSAAKHFFDFLRRDREAEMAPLRGLTSGFWLLASCWDDDSSRMRKPSQAALKPRDARVIGL